MRARFWKRLAFVVVFGTLSAPPTIDAGQRGRDRMRAAEQSRGIPRNQLDRPTRRRAGGSRIYQDPASAAGYRHGYDLGLLDGHDGHRYDPVRHRDYRDGQEGYVSSYGSKDAYKTNFRTGFRQGYEDGYREGARTR